MEINLQNIEEIIFLDKKAQEQLSEFRYLFDQWNLAHRVSGLRQMAQQSTLELLNGLGNTQLDKLEKYFGQPVFVNKLNKNLVDHYDCSIHEQDRLCEFSEYGGMTLYRKGDDLKFTFWR